ISRPLVSTKLLRLPTRGALGNGLRVVAGAVLASGGRLTVITRNRRIELRPEHNGMTKVIRATKIDFPIGTRIEIALGPALSDDQGALDWAHWACRLAEGKTYGGKSSPYWYDVPQFQELLYASGTTPVRELIANLDGCTGANAGIIVAAAKLNRAICKNVTNGQATDLLEAARGYSRPVNAERLGAGGSRAFAAYAYARSSGVACFGSPPLRAEVPFVVETWAKEENNREDSDTCLFAFINRTPVTGDINAARDKREINAFGCGLSHTIAQAPREAHFDIVVNIISPYVPITSDGKEPDLEPFLDVLMDVVQKAVRKAHRPNAGNGSSQKSIVLEHLDQAIADASGDGKYRFNQRQLFYVLRPIVL